MIQIIDAWHDENNSIIIDLLNGERRSFKATPFTEKKEEDLRVYNENGALMKLPDPMYKIYGLLRQSKNNSIKIRVTDEEYKRWNEYSNDNLSQTIRDAMNYWIKR